ncbi:MAG: hypothetical protein M3T55_13720 [Pseudomonadota bacterium]|nr:hypothetical protein [Pseudomonadota bacterium]
MTVPKPPVPDAHRPFIDQARKRVMKRQPSAEVVSDCVDGQQTIAPAHADREAWEIQLYDAFGTRSPKVIGLFLDQLSHLCRQDAPNGPWRPNEAELNAMIGVVNGVRPRNEIEAALAAQMVAVHLLTMRCAFHALRNEEWLDPIKAGLAGKLARTFAQQCDTLARIKGKVGRQTIKVRYERHDHKHVHVGEGVAEIGAQAFAPIPASPVRTRRFSRREHGARPALPGPHANGSALPGAGG